MQELVLQIRRILQEIPSIKEIIRYLSAKNGYYINGFLMDILYTAIIVFEMLYAIRSIIRIICWWRIFRKAKYPGWLSIIPIASKFCKYSISWEGATYILYVLSSIGILISPKWFIQNVSVIFEAGLMEGSISFSSIGTGILLMLIVFFSMLLIRILLEIVRVFKLRKVFNKSVWFGFGLLFFNTIFMLILAFGSTQYSKELKYKPSQAVPKSTKKPRCTDSKTDSRKTAKVSGKQIEAIHTGSQITDTIQITDDCTHSRSNEQTIDIQNNKEMDFVVVHDNNEQADASSRRRRRHGTHTTEKPIEETGPENPVPSERSIYMQAEPKRRRRRQENLSDSSNQ